MMAEEETTTMSTEEAAVEEEETIQPTVSWADGEPHYLGASLPDCSSGSTTSSDADDTDLPLSPKFSEEGSTTAAVMDEYSPNTPNTQAQSEVLHKTESANNIVKKEQPDICVSGGSSTRTPVEDTGEDVTTTVPTTMGNKVEDEAAQQQQPNTVSVAILQDSDEQEGEDVLKEFTNEDAISHGVLVSPSIGDNLIDQVCQSLSRPEMSNTAELDVVDLAPTLSDDSTALDGIILPPSISGLTTSPAPSPRTAPSPTNYPTSPPAHTMLTIHTSHSASQLMSLPIDSLHCVASFLTPLEWAQYGQTCVAASKICREIFRRVRMHGFRCATEVVSAWKLDQHADARELAALYISSGVPIYPFSMGHSYHTACWRMGIEAKSMQEKAQAAAGDNNNRPSDQSTTSEGDEEDNMYAVDRFFTERHNGTRETAAHIMCSYLEDKCMYTIGSTASTPPASPGRWNSMAAVPDARLPNLRSLSPLSAASTPPRSMSQTDLRGVSKSNSRQPKVQIQIHRHLLDQHLLGRSFVDDEAGDMKTPSISLSADFFHPHLCVHSISSHSRPLTTHPSTPREENLLEDPAFQAWAARAAATVHNRLGGAAVEDAEELAELQELYSQIFAVDRNPPAGDLENALRDAAAPPAVPPPPPPPPAVAAHSLGAGSLDDLSTLSPRHGYNSIVSSVDFEVYSASSANAKDKFSDVKRQLRTRFTFYQRRLEVLLSHGDSSGYEECMLDFWDEFFPLTAKIHYYDRHTAVPRISCLQQFLTQPCPKEVGIVQCEIERVKISSKRKGVSMKGRLFPTYEYRLFIKDRLHGKTTDEGEGTFEEDNGARRDTVLMIAKNRGRKHVDTSGVVSLTPAAKKGANNYYLYTPQQADVDTHYNAINETQEEETGNNNGCSLSTPPSGPAPPVLLGRLQSNFIGTEFQIYTPKLRKSLPGKGIRRCASMNESPRSFDEDYDSGAASDTGTPSRRRSRFGRLTLRRSSTGGSPTASERTLSPTSSRSSTRAPRIMNRRAIAIANSAEDAPDGDAESYLTNQQPFLCEEEDGAITYTANLLGSRPRIMDVCIPKISSEGHVGAVWRNYLENNEEPDDCAPYNRMLNCFKQLQQRLESQNANENEDHPNEENNTEQTDEFGLLALQNRPPWWNIELGSFVLNFRGRVSVASVKNFQLCDRNDHDHIMLQFGRIKGRHSFTMDYQYPLTAVQAFSIAISSLQSKISFG